LSIEQEIHSLWPRMTITIAFNVIMNNNDFFILIMSITFQNRFPITIAQNIVTKLLIEFQKAIV
ncbi:MAG TPA: hypothetical protein PLV81_05145, partial [Spirochaetota bacterium]|nr:hypothetical protein [Spirochaetota bacterium]